MSAETFHGKNSDVEVADDYQNEIYIGKDSSIETIDDAVQDDNSNINDIYIEPLFDGLNGDCHYGYWANGRFLTLLNFTDLANHGVTDILLNYFVYRENTMEVIADVVADARRHNINIPIWTQIFWESGVWTLPVKENGEPNQEFFDTKIEELKMIASIPGLYGINFDYFRFSGSKEYSGQDTWDAAEDPPGGLEAMSLFRTQAISAIREINPDIKISCCVGPGRDHYEDWFGFRYDELTAAFDMVLPMLYTGTFHKTPEWVYDEALWHLNNTKGAIVWIGLLAYINDDDMVPVPRSRISTEFNKVVETNPEGIMVFKWNWSEYLDFNNVTVDEEEFNSLKYLDYEVRVTEKEVNLTHDYAFDGRYDMELINGINLLNRTINGNNHTVDFKSVAEGFAVIASNVTINDLTILNANSAMIRVFGSSNVIFNNVHFIDNSSINTANKIFLYLGNQHSTKEEFLSSVAYISNCTFTSNILHRNDIASEGVNLVIKDSTFSGGETIYGHVYLRNAFLDMDNSIFRDLTSKYATAIFAETALFALNNTKFYNLNANLTAGAIAIKYVKNPYFKASYNIENCIFESISSKKDGGALYIDSGGRGGPEENLTINVRNCSFNNCVSEFGGAIVQLNSNLKVIDSNFTNNFAETAGGAIYASLANLIVINSSLINNGANFDAGAIFFDEGELNISKSNFTQNYVTYLIDGVANTIYLYNAEAYAEDSFFNNTGTSIFGYFSTFGSSNTDFVNDEISVDNEEYKFENSWASNDLNLINNTIYVDTIPSKFDLRDWGWVSPVVDQGVNGACWAFASIAALESALLKATGVTYNLSVNNLQNLVLAYSKYGSSNHLEGGKPTTAISHILSWLGVHESSRDEYDELGKISNLLYYSN